MKRYLVVAAVGAMSMSMWAQAGAKKNQSHQSAAESATEAKSGIHDTVDVVSGPTVDQVTSHSAVLHWTTNKTAATRVNYGTEASHMTQKAYKAGGEKDHAITLNNLKPHQTYYYEIENRSGKDRLNGNFTTH